MMHSASMRSRVGMIIKDSPGVLREGRGPPRDSSGGRAIPPRERGLMDVAFPHQAIQVRRGCRVCEGTAEPLGGPDGLVNGTARSRTAGPTAPRGSPTQSSTARLVDSSTVAYAQVSLSSSPSTTISYILHMSNYICQK